ncbi:MAG: NADH-quinone oxidoreductase subunit J [Alphaproteobacteria bacterium]|nr:NADH-quinone oxidoreductase subunit J [Alphaproteobacteria bacterium]MBF0251181.1 NADH-quinone oxidoreductase subunit J [Alphaproteobacteria bacterium]
MIETLVFYMFAIICVASGVLVVTARNPVNSVLFLILAFFNAGGLFVLAGAEFIAMLLIIVYVGAVAVLFMFVVMMLDVTVTELKQGFTKYLPIGLLVTVIFAVEVLGATVAWHMAPEAAANIQAATPAADAVSNTSALGKIIYTNYAYLFQAAGLVLLVAMIGAIVLTHRKRRDSKKQVIAKQLARKASEAVELKKVETGRGI